MSESDSTFPPRPTRVLFVGHTAELSGAELALLNVVRHLDRSVYEPVVVLFSEGPLVARLRDAGVRTHVLPLPAGIVRAKKDKLGLSTLLSAGEAFRVAGHVLRLSRLIRRERVALVHTNSLKADLIGGLAGRLARRPVVWHLHDRIESDYLPARVARIFRMLARRIPTGVVANSDSTLATLRLPPEVPSTVAPPGLPPEALVHHREPPRANSADGQHEIRIGIVGRISPWKGQDVFLRAAARVARSFPQARFLIVGASLFGEREYEANLRELARSLGVEDRVEFTGQRDDARELMASFDVFVHASTTPEPFGQVVVEAMAAGTPVVATNAGGVREIVRHEETGLLVPTGDVDATAAAVERLLREPAAARAMADRARASVAERFTIAVTIRELVDFYDRILPPRVPRVLFVDHTAELSGGELAMLNLTRRLDARRYRPIVVLFSDGPLVARLREAGVETRLLPLHADVVRARKDRLGLRTLLRFRDVMRAASVAWRLAGLIRRERAAIVHTNSLKADIIGGVAARLSRRPVIWHVRDRIDRPYLPANVAAAFRRLARIVPNAVVANSASTLATLRLPSRVRAAIVPSGVVLDDTVAVRATNSSQRGELRVGIVGRICPWKGQHVFLGAAARVAQAFPTARFHVVGGSLFGEREYEDQLRATSSEPPLAGRVEFTGHRDDVRALLSTFDVFVHASTTPEPFGQVIVEAMAAGVPVVATAGGGVMEIVEDGVTGLLVPMGDAAAMAAAVERLLADPVPARAMADRARETVHMRFGIDVTVAAMTKVYDGLLHPNDTVRQSHDSPEVVPNSQLACGAS